MTLSGGAIYTETLDFWIELIPGISTRLLHSKEPFIFYFVIAFGKGHGWATAAKSAFPVWEFFFQYDSICLDDGIFFAVVITAAKSPTLWILSVGFVSVSLWNICTSPITGAEVVTIAIWVEVAQYSSIICALFLNIWTRCRVACSFEQDTLHLLCG